jgi:UPF0042 nucleotide-binding protein
MGGEAPVFPVLILTGLSGAGKTTVLHVFEDMLFFVMDGLPLELAPGMLPVLRAEALSHYRGIVIGVDLRQHYAEKDFSKLLGELRGQSDNVRLLFVQASSESILRRYAATRRPHPLEAEGLGLEQAVAAEGQRLAALRDMADLVFDSSDFSIHDLRRHVLLRCAGLFKNAPRFRVHLISFGFKYGQPSEADMTFDLRFLPNPFFVEALRPSSGLDKAVADYVLAAEPGGTFLSRLVEFLEYLLPLFEAEGRYRLAIAFGCTGGRHRSVAFTEAVRHILKPLGFAVSVEHRHLELG